MKKIKIEFEYDDGVMCNFPRGKVSDPLIMLSRLLYHGVIHNLKIDEGEDSEIESQIHISALVAKCEAIGRWMSTALDDPSVCEEMKIDIGAYFDGVSGLTKIFPKI